jgi:hypothetical protein
MADLRTEIREAFDKEQSTFPPPAALRHELLQTLGEASQRRGSAAAGARPNRQWLAVGAAILLTVAIVAGFMAVRFEHATAVPGRPGPITHVTAPQAIPGTDYGPPPAGVPLLYVWDTSRPGSLLGFDWSGRPRATLDLGSTVSWQSTPIRMSPDGHFFVLLESGVFLFLDRFGRRIANSPAALGFGTWADDNRHMCQVDFDNKTAISKLLIQSPNEGVRQVAEIAPTAGTGRTYINVIACSIKNDRAIAVRYSSDGVSELWVIRLSSGEVVSHRTYARGSVASVVASRDATYLAENSTLAWQPSPQQGAPLTTVRRVSDWQVILTLPGQVVVRGFSADDSRVLAVKDGSDPLGPILSEIFDRSSRHVLWHNLSTEEAMGFDTRVGSGDLVLEMRSPIAPACPMSCLLPVGLVFVQADGSTIQVPGLYNPVW